MGFPTRLLHLLDSLVSQQDGTGREFTRVKLATDEVFTLEESADICHLSIL